MDETLEVTESEITPVEDTSLRDELVSAFEAAETEAALAVDSPVEEKSTRVRDEHGRFAKSEDAPVDAPADTPNLEQSAATEPPTAPQGPSLDTLPHLTSDEKAVLKAASPDVQRIVASKLDETHRKLSDAGRKIAAYRDLDESLAPRKQQLALAGISEGQYLKQIMTAADMLDANPVHGLKYFIRHYGIDPSSLIDAPGQAPDPVREELETIKAHLAQQQQAEVTRQQAQLSFAIESFRNAKDAQGKALRPHLDAVQAELVPLIHAVRAQTPNLTPEQVLQEAYDRAVYANPQTRQLVSQTQAQKAEAERIAKAREAASAAKARGGSIVGSPGSGATPAQSLEIGDLLRAGFNGHN